MRDYETRFEESANIDERVLERDKRSLTHGVAWQDRAGDKYVDHWNKRKEKKKKGPD